MATKESMVEILKKHKKWLNDKEGGERADLRDAKLRDADLAGANLRRASLVGAKLRDADLTGADLAGADLTGADLVGANLTGAGLRAAKLKGANLVRADLSDVNLWGADLTGTNLDFSCWPLWCGSFDVKVDEQIVAQLAYHFCRLNCDSPKYQEARETLKELANQFHRIDECGRIENSEKLLDGGKNDN